MAPRGGFVRHNGLVPPTPRSSLGAYLREQRQLARLSLRELSRLSHVSNAYLSQLERGLHEPSLRVLESIAVVLGIPVTDLVGAHSPGRDQVGERDLEEAIRREPTLTRDQKEALLAVYRGFLTGPADAAG